MKTSKQWSSMLASGQRHAVAVLLCIGCMGTNDLAAQPLPSISESPGDAENQTLDAAYGAAQDHYDRNHWQDAFSSFARLAEKRHRQSAQVAFQMWTYGPVLYKTAFFATKDQILLWCVLSNSGSASEAGALLSLQQCGSR